MLFSLKNSSLCRMFDLKQAKRVARVPRLATLPLRAPMCTGVVYGLSEISSRGIAYTHLLLRYKSRQP